MLPADKARAIFRSATPDEWAELINEICEIKGWNEGTKSPGEWAALAHSEISEAFEEARNGKPLIYDTEGKPEGEAVEYADCVIRIMHWFAQHNISLNETLKLKVVYNAGRTYRHGGKQI